jgi:succinate dehydrogenase hydrophobic anchor subunit
MILCFLLKLSNGSAKLYYPSWEAFESPIVLILLLLCLVDSSVYSAHAVWASLIDYQFEL